jgi:hypothetical protein
MPGRPGPAGSPGPHEPHEPKGDAGDPGSTIRIVRGQVAACATEEIMISADCARENVAIAVSPRITGTTGARCDGQPGITAVIACTKR